MQELQVEDVCQPAVFLDDDEDEYNADYEPSTSDEEESESEDDSDEEQGEACVTAALPRSAPTAPTGPSSRGKVCVWSGTAVIG